MFKIHSIFQGRMEERLPFVLISFPEWFRQSFPSAMENLYINSENRLTSPYDLHEMLLDLLEPGTRLENETIKKRSVYALEEIESSDEYVHNITRGISLFLPITTNRTCEQAGIDLHWCTCQVSMTFQTLVYL